MALLRQYFFYGNNISDFSRLAVVFNDNLSRWTAVLDFR